MTDEKADRSRRSVRQKLFELQADEVTDRGGLLARVVHLLVTNAGSEAIAIVVGRIRSRGDAEQCTKLDQILLDHIAGIDGTRKKLEAVHSDLRASIQDLLNPPFFPARYLGSVMTHAGEFAQLAHDGTQRVVAFGNDLGPGDLAAGDEVLLCHERNAVIAKSPGPGSAIGETAALARCIGDGRLVLEDRGTEVIVSVSARLAAEPLRPGDLILWDRGARIALGRVEPGANPGYEDIGNSVPPQLGGLDQVCESVLARFVFSILQPDLAREYRVQNDGARRLLLQGAPGTGKTTLMRIVASRIAHETRQHCRVVTISGAELYSSYVGETERNIRRCFATLNDYDGPGIAFFDEIDAIGRARGNASGHHDDRFLGTLLAELEGMRRSDVAVIAATNRADTLDAALRGRFSWEIEMPRPDMQAARQIFSIHMPEDVPYQPNSGEAPRSRQSLIDSGVSRLYEPNADNKIASLQFRDGKRREVAARELVSGRLIEQMCAAARAAAFERECRGGESGVSAMDMQAAAAEAIARMRKTLTTRNVRNFLADLPQDLDVVSVEAMQPRVETARYVR